MTFSFSTANLFRVSVASLASVSLITLANYLVATQPLTQEAFARQQKLLKLNQASISEWWLGEVNRVHSNLNDPGLVSRSLLILQAKRHSRSDFDTPLSIGLRNDLDSSSGNRNSVSLLTKGGIVVFSTTRQKLLTYQPLKNTTTSVELAELATTPLNFFTNSTTNLPSISVALPITNAEKKRAGFLAIDLNLRRLTDLVSSSVQAPQAGRDLSVPIQSYLAARTSLDRVTQISPPSSLPADKLATYKFDPLDSVGIRNALDGQSGQGLYLNSKSQPVIGVYQYLPNFRTALLVESLQHDVYAPARNQALLIFAIGLLLSISPFVLGLILAGRSVSHVHED